ncbi:hypothetical protein JW877_03135 [bacterium]|nr:hypothetical protein [bacterium]
MKVLIKSMAILFIVVLFWGPLEAINKIPASRMKEIDGNPVGPKISEKISYYPAVTIWSTVGSTRYREHAVYSDSIPMMIWPHATVDRNDRVHVVAMENLELAVEPQMLGYFRSDDGGRTFDAMALVDSISTISAVVAASPVSDKVAIVYTRPRSFSGSSLDDYNNDVVYVESTDGLSWDFATRINTTAFFLADTFRAYCDLDAIYDYEDELHIVFNVVYFDELLSYIGPSAAKIWHWSEAAGLSEVADGWYDVTDPGNWNRTVCKPNIGVDPSSGYLYCTWTQFDTLDVSATGLNNGDICAAVSTDGGLNWEEPHNLTRTPSPGATAGNCKSEHWASLSALVNGFLHIIYVSDRDAGGAVTDPVPEGTWTLNDIKYLKIPADQLLETPPADTLLLSPGLTVGTSWYDYQQNASMGKMIAVDNDGGVHLVWMNGLDYLAINRHIYYNYCDSEGDWLAPGEGVLAEGFTRGGYCTLGLFSDNRPAIAYHTTLIYLDVSGPEAEIVAPMPDTYSACPEQDILLTLFDPRGVNPASIILSVDAFLYEPSDDELNYDGEYLTFTPSVPWENGQEVQVALLAAEDSLGNPLEEMLLWNFTIDLAPPIAIFPYPANGRITSCPGSPVTVVVRDSLSGLNLSAFRFNIQGRSFSFADASLTLEGDLIQFYPPSAGMIFTDGETLTVTLEMEDSPDYCSPNSDEFTWYYAVDITGPIASMPLPPNGAMISETSPDISVHINDNLSGVNPATVILTVNSDTFAWSDSVFEWDGEVLLLPAENHGLVFSPGERVEVSLIQAKDRPHICPANSLQFRPFTWDFTIFAATSMLPDTSGSAGDTVGIPLTIQNLGSYAVESIHILMNIDPGVIIPVGCSFTGAITEGWTTDLFSFDGGILNILISGSPVSAESGIFSFIKFQVDPAAIEASYSILDLLSVTLNEGASTELIDGSFIVDWNIPVWLMDLRVLDNSGALQRTLTFGLGEGASPGFDPGMDIIALPRPYPEAEGTFFINDEDYPYINNLVRDIKPPDAIPAIWLLPTAGDGYLEWNPDFLPGGWITINDSMEMHSARNYHFNDYEEIIIKFAQPELGIFNFHLEQNWNLISLPVIPQGWTMEALFPTKIGDIYSFNPVSHSYVIAEEIQPGYGYWVYSDRDTAYNVGGMIVYSIRRGLTKGWNLLGSPVFSVAVDDLETDPPGLMVTPVYGFDTSITGYIPETILQPGKGYWIMFNEEGYLETGE